MGRKITMLAMALIMAITNVNGQKSFYSQDPCAQQLMQNGCTETFENVEIVDPILDVLCPGMKVKLVVSKLVCNGVTVSVHIWSAGAWAPATSPCNPAIGGIGNPNWETLKAEMKSAIERQKNSYIASLGLNSLLVATGSVCKAEVSFEVGYFDRAIPLDGGSGINYIGDPGGKYFVIIPCKSNLCCYGQATVVNGKIVSVIQMNDPSGSGCPEDLSEGDVQSWFNDAYNVIPNPPHGTISNVEIESCKEQCDLSRLVGKSAKSASNLISNQKVNYNISLLTVNSTSLVFKSDIKPINYQIIDINGREIDGKTILSHTIDISTLSKGLYFFKANYDNGISSVVKFTKD